MSAATLYCNEKLTGDDDVLQSDGDTSSLPEYTSPSDESSFIYRLFGSELRHMPHTDYLRRCQNRPIYLTYRQDSVNSILKVHALYQFKPVTAFVSINYLDRFLSSQILPESSIGWAFQLVSVACLSLASKMEEIDVPMLVDLQIAGGYIFEPITIQRMELLVMSTLKWRLRSVTPFDYLHYFVSKLSCSRLDSISTIQSVASTLILNTSRVIDFMGFPPSVVAAAAVISAAGEGEIVDQRLNREMVRSCHQLMVEYVLDTCPSEGFKGVSIEPLPPPSPVGVLDAATCVTCDTTSGNLSSVTGAGEAEPETSARDYLYRMDMNRKHR